MGQNRDDALSPAGEEQVVAACQLLQQGTFPPTLVKYSLAASSIDAANLVGRELRLGRDRLVPEFTFLDPRAVGAWDSSNRTTTLPAVWAMDNDEAGRDGLLGRPPATVDGTPHEVLADQAVRLRQLLSILESQYSGDTILLIFPDGTGPALLSAMIAGIPYNRVHELEFGPGEVRFDVTMDSTLALWKTKQLQDGEAYHAVLQQGRENLKRLRATAKNGGTVVNLKDQKLEEERVAIDQKMRERESVRVAAEKIDQELRLKRQREVEVQRGEISVSPTVTGAAEFAVLGGVVLAVGSEWNRNADAKKDDKKSIGAVSSQPELIATIPELDIMADPGLYPTPVAGATKQGVVGASSGGSVADKGEVLDLKEAAVRAMEEYMNKDDGADDWLMSLSQIIEETVDEEESEVKDSVQGIVVPDDEESFQ